MDDSSDDGLTSRPNDRDTKPNRQSKSPRSVSILGNLLLAWRYVWNECWKQKKNFFIGFTAVWLVVFSIVILQNTVTLAPILFLLIGETSSGEMDIIMNPGRQGLLNYTEVANLLHNTPHLVGVSPRWVLFSLFSKSEDYYKNATAISLILDSKKEKEIGLGRRWTLPPLEGRTCQVTTSLMSFLGVDNGANITVSMDVIQTMAAVSGYGSDTDEFVRGLLQGIVDGESGLNPFLPPGVPPRVIVAILNVLGIDVDGILNGSTPVDSKRLRKNFTTREWFIVQDQITASAGKYPSSLGNVILLEADAIQDIVSYWQSEARKGNFRAIFPSMEITEQQQQLINYLLQLYNPSSSTTEANQAKRYIDNSLDAPGASSVPSPNASPSINIPPVNFTIPPSWNIPNLPPINFGPNQPPGAIAPNAPFVAPIPTNFTRPNPNNTRDFNLREAAMMIVGMNSERFARYSGTKDDLDAAWLEWTNDIAMKLGLDYPASLSTPLGKMLGVLYYLRLVLDQMLLIVELFLIALGCFLIYSLLLADVESKVYESGMLRALGMQQTTLIALLSLQSLLFSIPGLSFGLLLSWLAWLPLRYILVKYTLVPTPYGLFPIPIVVGVTVGLLMPLAALIGPVQRSLSKTLRDSLDLYHSIANDTTVIVTKLEHLGLSPAQTWGSLLMVGFGFVIYYLVPLSFIFLNLPLFFTIFVAVLAGMLIGLCLLALLFHTKIQLLVMHSIMWFADARKLKPLVKKNLHGHNMRNNKTAILFTTCIAFIVFAGAIFQLQTANIVSTIQVSIGSDIVVATYSSNPANKLDEQGITEFLSKLKGRPNSPVVDFGFSTFALNDLDHMAYDRIGNLAELPTKNTLIYGVSSNFMNTVFDKFAIITQKDNSITYKSTRSGVSDVIQSLYDHPSIENAYGKDLRVPPDINVVASGATSNDAIEELSNEWIYNHSIPIIISAALRIPLSVDTSTPVAFIMRPIAQKVGRFTAVSTVYGLAQPRAIVSKIPGFLFSSYQQTSGIAPCLVSIEAYDYLRRVTWDASFKRNETMPVEIPKRAVYVRLVDGATTADRERITNGLRNYVSNDLIQVIETSSVVSAISTAVWVIYVFSNVVAFLVMILCFFTLLVSFTSNINENSWEFGVLRAIGLTSFQVIRLYIYEASCVIVSSVLLGSIVGILVAITLTLQSDLFSELPFHMEFPFFLFFSLVIMSVVTAFLSSWIPAYALGKRRIAGVLKGK